MFLSAAYKIIQAGMFVYIYIGMYDIYIVSVCLCLFGRHVMCLLHVLGDSCVNFCFVWYTLLYFSLF